MVKHLQNIRQIGHRKILIMNSKPISLDSLLNYSDEMFNEVKKTLPVDLAVCTAAVTDFNPAEKSKNEIKKVRK